MLYKMYDDANVSIFAGTTADAYAGYVDGYVTYPWLTQHYASKHLISISIHGNKADCLDIESGAASVSVAPSWYRLAKARKLHTTLPVIYCSAGTASEVIGYLADHGVKRADYLLWSAHYGKGRHICGPATCGYPAANGTQFTDKALGRSLDESVLAPEFFKAPKKEPVHYPAVRHVADGTVSLKALAARRDTTVTHIADVSATHLEGHNAIAFMNYILSGTDKVMPKGLVFWTQREAK